MKTKLLLTLAILALFVAATNAQNKIGDNPTTINAASLLELESTNKGLLLPRVSLISATAWSPLLGTAVDGMTVFSSGGAIPNGIYYWDNTQSKWLLVSSSGGYYIGDIRYVYSSTAPATVKTETDGTVWFYADGQTVNAGTYPTSPFAGQALPDLRDRVLANYSGANAINTNAGAQTHTNTVGEMASHTHIQDAHTHTINNGTLVRRNSGGPNFQAGSDGYGNPTTLSNANATATNQNTGGGAAWDIRQPTYYCAIYIRIL